jgi:hypothetical protein
MTESPSPDDPRSSAPKTTFRLNEERAAPALSIPGTLAGNLGEPIHLRNVNLCGVSAESVRGPSHVKIWTRLALISDDPLFHKIAENLCAAIVLLTEQAGAAVNLGRADTVLLVIRPDNTAELWVDTAAVALLVMIKRKMQPGSVVLEKDIADVTGVAFPLVDIGPRDRVLCLFRTDWRFALFFDFNPEGNLDTANLRRTLGTLYRNLKYRHIYDIITNEAVFDRLISSGWFPFAEIIGTEFRSLASCCEAEFELADTEAKLIRKFGRERLDRMLSRWLVKPHFASKEPLLKRAVDAFEAGDPITAIKIVLTEIEGVLANAYRGAHGRGAKLRKLLEFATLSAERKAGGPDTLLLPSAFARYLTSYTFADFDPAGPAGSAASRHTVSHGAAAAESYTQVRALQALLTLDQIAFYT